MRQDPLRIYRYRLEIDRIEQAGFCEVAIGDLSTDPIEYRGGDEPATERKLNGLNKYANITLKWGITDSTELANWQQLVVDDAILLGDARRSVVLRMQNEAGEEKAAFEVVTVNWGQRRIFPNVGTVVSDPASMQATTATASPHRGCWKTRYSVRSSRTKHPTRQRSPSHRAWSADRYRPWARSTDPARPALGPWYSDSS